MEKIIISIIGILIFLGLFEYLVIPPAHKDHKNDIPQILFHKLEILVVALLLYASFLKAKA